MGLKERCKKNFKNIEKQKNRKATFVCSLSIKLNNKKTISALGKVNGTISYKILGKKGFGYDPIFIPKNKTLTFGQMLPKKKFRIDHRFIAFKKLKKKNYNFLNLFPFNFIHIQILNNFTLVETK